MYTINLYLKKDFFFKLSYSLRKTIVPLLKEINKLKADNGERRVSRLFTTPAQFINNWPLHRMSKKI
jgi:hypothetical protein